MPATNAATGGRKVGKMLARDGDLNSTWPVLRAAFVANPGPVLAALAELAGYETPKPKADIDDVLERVMAIGRRADENARDIAEVSKAVMRFARRSAAREDVA